MPLFYCGFYCWLLSGGCRVSYRGYAPDVSGKNLFGIRVTGESMEPTLYDGDILIINPHKKFTRGLAVVRHHWGYKIRNVHKRGNNSYTLAPVNPAYD